MPQDNASRVILSSYLLDTTLDTREVWRWPLFSSWIFFTAGLAKRESVCYPEQVSRKTAVEFLVEPSEILRLAEPHVRRSRALEQVSRPAIESGKKKPGWVAQIFDNLVGCSKEELVSTLSKTGANLGWGTPQPFSLI